MAGMSLDEIWLEHLQKSESTLGLVKLSEMRI